MPKIPTMKSYLYYSIRSAPDDKPQSMRSIDKVKDHMNNSPVILGAASARAGEIYRTHLLERTTLGIVFSLAIVPLLEDMGGV